MMKSNSARELLDIRKWERGTIVLPTIDRELKHMSFFMQYPMVQKTKDDIDVGDGHSNPVINFCPVGTWLNFSATAHSSATEVPIIVMACRDFQVIKALQDQCVSGNWTLDRLAAAPIRIFSDLFVHLAQWSDVWRCARRELSLRNAQLHGEAKILSVLQQTRALHRDTANAIAMRDDLRLHMTAFQKLQKLLRIGGNQESELLCASEKEAGKLGERVEECLQNLQHQQDSSAVILNQLENLLSLAFNTEMVSKGQAVARLNTLAFGFLPLSYVATIFGMTNFSISSAWYPLWAVIVVALVLLAFSLTKILSEWRARRANRPRNRPPKSSNRLTKPMPNTSASPNLPSQPYQKPSASSLDPSPIELSALSATHLPPASPSPSPRPDPSAQPASPSRWNPMRLTRWGRKQTWSRIRQSVDPAGPSNMKVFEPTDMGFLSVNDSTIPELEMDDHGYRGWGSTSRRLELAEGSSQGASLLDVDGLFGTSASSSAEERSTEDSSRRSFL